MSEPSRRGVVSGLAAAPLAGGAAEPPAVALGRRWLAVEAERERLSRRWGEVEERLARRHGWFRLSPAERAALPAGRALGRIEARLEALAGEGEALLAALLSGQRRGPAASLAAVAVRLQVAGRLVAPEDHPEAHALIVRAARDLGGFGDTIPIPPTPPPPASNRDTRSSLSLTSL